MNQPVAPARYQRQHQFRRRGSAVLDAALVFPILISLTFGCVEFGHYFYIKHTLQGAAREGARAAAMPGSSNTEVSNVVRDALKAAGITTAQYTNFIRDKDDTTNVNVASQVAGTPILVKVQCNWGTVGIRPIGLIGSAKVVTGMTTMRKEG